MSGLSGARAYKWEQYFMSRLKEVMSDHIRRMTTREESTVALETSVYKHTMWNQLPQRSRARISGYLEATRDHTYANLVHWRMFLDGALRTSKEVDALAETEVSDMHAAFAAKCEESVREYKEEGGSCRHPPTREEFNRRFIPSDYKSPWSRIESDKSKHVWDKDPTKVY